MEPKAIAKKLVEYAAVTAVLGTMGTYWINTEVERRMNELASDPSTSPVVVANSTKLASLEQGQIRIEAKVDKFSEKFLEYLERQANN